MEWQKLTKKTMPPDGVKVLFWLDFGHCGFPVCGSNQGGEILYASNWNGLTHLDHREWRSTRWALIESPEGENA